MVRVALIAAIALFGSTASGQTLDPAAHWVGGISLPTGSLGIEVDLARTLTGHTTGTISIPAQQITGLPLSKVEVSGASITFEARTDQGFAGTLSADGTSMSGDFSFSGSSFPFALTRVGSAHIQRVSPNPPISTDLEGTWNGIVTLNGNQMRLRLNLVNEANVGATGALINLDEGSLTIPIAAINQNALDVSLGFRVIDGTYTAKMSADHSELSGIWVQGNSTASITFKRELPRQ